METNLIIDNSYFTSNVDFYGGCMIVSNFKVFNIFDDSSFKSTSGDTFDFSEN